MPMPLTTASRGCALPLGYLLYHVSVQIKQLSGLIRTLYFIYASCYPSVKRKEYYPSYIAMSNRRFRSERSKFLSKLIGHNFTTLRGHRQLSLEKIAADTAVPIKTLRQLEAGTIPITAGLLITICDYFGVLVQCMVKQDLSIEQ